MRKIIIAGLASNVDLAPCFYREGKSLYLGATVDLCRQMRTELVRLHGGNASFVTFQDLARSFSASRRLLSPLEQEALFAQLAQNRWPQIQSMAEFPGFWLELARAAAELAGAGATVENLRTVDVPGLPGEVCQLVASYWQYLEERKLCDKDLGLKYAAQALGERTWSQLFVDGFTDFTALQEETLALLCQRAQQVIIKLVGATTQEAHTLAQRLGGDFQLEDLSHENEFILASQVQVLAAASQKQEVEEVCRWLKQQLKAGVAPSDMVLIARHPDQYRNQVAQTLAQMEIPSEVTAKVEDLELPPVLAARTALCVVREDWPQASFIRLVQLLLGADLASVLDRLSREANLLGGSASWQELLEKSLGDEGEAVLSLCQELAQLSGPQRVEEYSSRLWQLVRSRFTLSTPGKAAIFGVLALSRLEAILGELSSLAPYYPEELELDAFERLFLKALGDANQQLSERAVRRGTGVRLVDPVGARGLTWQGAAILGLEEGAYPTPWPEDWLFAEELRQAFKQKGIRLQLRGTMAGRERDFFQLALSRGKVQLLLSYKTLDESGSPILPSPYLVELLQKRGFPRHELSLSQQFPEKCSLLATERELALFAQAKGNRQLWAQYQGRRPRLAEQISRAGAVIKKRNSKLWSPFDGQLPHPEILAALPFSSRTIWSASQLETYGSCPFRFFCQEVLKVKPLTPLEAQLSPKDLGTVLHNVLADFYQNHSGQCLSSSRRDDYRQELVELLAAHWQGRGEDIFDNIQKENARHRLFRFLDRELKRLEAGGLSLLPHLVEASFGMGEDPLPGPLEVELPGGAIRLRGRIDRLDLAAGGDFLVLDYKLSYVPSYSELASGLSFQLPIYLWAGEKILGEGARPIAALFYSLGQAQFRGFWRDEETKRLGLRRSKNSSLDEERWTQIWDQYRQLLSDVITRMAAGDFRLLPEKCPSYCDYTTICRYQKWRIDGKGGSGSA